MPHGPIDRAVSGQSRALSAEAEGGPATPTDSITGVGGGQDGMRDLLQALSSGALGAEQLLEVLQLLIGQGQGGQGGPPIPQGGGGLPGGGGGNPIEQAVLGGGGGGF